MGAGLRTAIAVLKPDPIVRRPAPIFSARSGRAGQACLLLASSSPQDTRRGLDRVFRGFYELFLFRSVLKSTRESFE